MNPGDYVFIKIGVQRVSNKTVTLLIDKYIGIKTDRKLYARKGETVTVYDESHKPVLLCYNIKGESFAINEKYVQ